MRHALVTCLLVAAACAAAPLRPSAFDPSKGTAQLSLGPASGSDRASLSRGFALLSVRDATGQVILSQGEEVARGQCTERPIELNPGRYTVEIVRCPAGCSSAPARFTFDFEAQRGHDYRVELEKALLTLRLTENEWRAFLVDETTGGTRPLGEVRETCL
jgi:hypothetical protein